MCVCVRKSGVENGEGKSRRKFEGGCLTTAKRKG